MGEGKLLHPLRIAEELEPAGGARRRPIRLHLDNLPAIVRRQETVDWNRSADVAQFHVERVSLTVRPESLLVQPVCPGTHERDPHHRGFGLELLDRRVGPAKNLLPLHGHIEGDVSHGGNDRNHDVVSGIAQLDDVAGLSRRVLLRSHRRGGDQERDEDRLHRVRSAESQSFLRPSAPTDAHRCPPSSS